MNDDVIPLNEIGKIETVKVYNQAYVDKLEEKISVLLSCKNCPENKGGLLCQKEYEDKCLAQKIQYIKELEEEIAELEKELEQAKKVQVVEHFEAYGQCRDSRRIASLEKENEELKNRNAELKGVYAHSAREAGTYKQFLELKEKENAEQKDKLSNLESVAEVRLANWQKYEQENAELKEQNYKTKVALRNVIDYLGQFCSDYPDCVIEAEQFLKECE